MRPVIRRILMALPLLFFVATLPACGTGNNEIAIEKSIRAGEQLTESEYGVIIDYCGEYASRADVIQRRIGRAAPGSEEYERGADALARLAASYPYVDIFNSAIASCSQSEIGHRNARLVEQYAPLQYFTAPSWAVNVARSDVM